MQIFHLPLACKRIPAVLQNKIHKFNVTFREICEPFSVRFVFCFWRESSEDAKGRPK